MTTPDEKWVYLNDAAALIAYNRTVEEARESLLQTASEGLTILRAFRLKSRVSAYHSDESELIASIIENGNPFDEGQMPAPRNIDYAVDQKVTLADEEVDEFLYSTEPGWVLVDFDEKTYVIESETIWETSTFKVRRIDLTVPGPYNDDKSPYFVKHEKEYLKVQANASDLEILYDLYGAVPVSRTANTSSDELAEKFKARSGGRKMHKQWPEFVAELALYLHSHGYPVGSGADGQDELINAVLDRLASRGIEGPSRTTVQPAVAAVLRRFRTIEQAT